MQVTRTVRGVALTGALLSLAAGCEARSAAPRVETLPGEIRAVGQGSARSWVAVGPLRRPIAVGITLPAEALAHAPDGAPAVLTLRLPDGVAGTGFDHIEVEWLRGEPAGQEPSAPPHLDVRFFLVSAEERVAIGDSARAARVPDLDLIPTSYVPLAGLVPRLGVRWTDAAAHGFRGAGSTDALLYGFYDGRLTVLESRLTGALLESRRSYAHKIKLPREYARPGYYPTRYRVRYEASSREYTIALEGLAHRP